MPIIPVGFGHVTYEINHVVANKVYNVTHGVDLDLTTLTTQEVIDELVQRFKGSWVAQLDTGWQVQGGRMQVGNDGPPIVVVSTDAPSQGTRSGDQVPPNWALIIRKRTAFGGRQFRGRMYFPGITQDGDVDETGRISQGRQTALQAIADTWLDDLNNGTGGLTSPQKMVLLHNPPQSGTTAPSPTDVTSLQVQLLGGTQRRRMRFQ